MGHKDDVRMDLIYVLRKKITIDLYKWRKKYELDNRRIRK
jgi:hypothetical protein